ncbi:MAG TPA: type II toxin-antitoxin system HicB family antitoxin [Oceanipulchritudo sp.]|nr:type II toxin-antitoxin system HicB family antitoxin [Oceanipulchritudo sp.]
MKYTIVIEKGEHSWGAYVPDLPGCVAAAESREEVVTLIREAIELHLDGLLEDGKGLPSPQSEAVTVEIQIRN